MTRFTKPPLTPAQQLQLLEERGLSVNSHDRALRLLEVTTLFRLSPYMRALQFANDPHHRFKPGSELASIVRFYRFDSELRQLMMVAIERIEVAVRACISNVMAPEHGSHWHTERMAFNKTYNHARMLTELEKTLHDERKKFAKEVRHIKRSRASEQVKQQRIESRKRDNYPRYYALTYTEPAMLPSWAAMEELSLGGISHLYQGLARDRDRKKIARRFELPQGVLQSWLHTLTFVRNICAHHARLWNRELGIPPTWPERLETPDGRPGRNVPRRLFTVVMMLTYLTRQISPDTRWTNRLQALLAEYPKIPRAPMGFSDDWQARLNGLEPSLSQSLQQGG